MTVGSVASGMDVEGVAFSATVTPPGSTKELVLGGAGVRGLMIEGKFVTFTAIGVYIEKSIVPHLALKWKDSTAEDLGNRVDFYMDIVTCPYEKFTRVTLILPLSGAQYSEKVSEGCKAAWEAAGIYGEAEAKAIEQFKDIFQDQNFPPCSSILFTISPTRLVIAFSKDGSIPEKAAAVIENRIMAEGVLASIIGKSGVSPPAKASIADRVSKLYFPELDHCFATVLNGVELEGIAFPPTVRPPGGTKDLVLGGAGVRQLPIQGKVITFTTIGVYIDSAIVPYLANKWRGKTIEELNDSSDFFMDIVTCEYEKFTRVTMILPLTGIQYSEKVTEGCKAAWEAAGIYGKAEAEAIEEFKQAFKDQNFPPGSSILFTISPTGLAIAFSEDCSIPEKGRAVIKSRVLAQGVLASIIGKHGVSPAARASLAARLSQVWTATD
uniref:Chalcone-flavonone isomerase family protein n=1 Tax=Picea sitchensis TaxID=3332 RepID=D5ADH5_PICSI|nr:unknown [Picea sitchensis]